MKFILSILALVLIAAGAFVIRTFMVRQGPQAALVPAQSADTFVDSIGFNNYLGEQPPYEHFDTILKPRLIEIGIRHIRDFLLPRPYHDRKLLELKAAGITCLCSFDIAILNPRPSDHLVPVQTYLDEVKRMIEVVEGVEGPNEYNNRGYWENNTPPLGWEETLRNYTRDLYTAFKADPLTANIPVLGPTFSEFGREVGVGDLGQWVDYGNIHYYNDYWTNNSSLLPTAWLAENIQHFGAPYRAPNTERQLWMTETGYLAPPAGTTDPFGLYVSETVQAKYLLRRLAALFDMGFKHTFIYAFADFETPRPHPRFGGFYWGVLRGDGSPKPAFSAIKNIITVLKDPGEDFVTGALDYEFVGNLNGVEHLLLQKRDGTFYILVWLEDGMPSTDQVRARELTLSFGTSATLTVYNPLLSATPLGQYPNQTTLTLSVPDSPLIVEVSQSGRGHTETPTPTNTPGGGSTNTPGPSPSVTGTGSSAATQTVTRTPRAPASGTLDSGTPVSASASPPGPSATEAGSSSLAGSDASPTPALSALSVLTSLAEKQKPNISTGTFQPAKPARVLTTAPTPTLVPPAKQPANPPWLPIILAVAGIGAGVGLLWMLIARARAHRTEYINQ